MKKREGGESIWAISPRERQPGVSNLCDETSSTVAGMGDHALACPGKGWDVGALE